MKCIDGCKRCDNAYTCITCKFTWRLEGNICVSKSLLEIFTSILPYIAVIVGFFGIIFGISNVKKLKTKLDKEKKAKAREEKYKNFEGTGSVSSNEDRKQKLDPGHPMPDFSKWGRNSANGGIRYPEEDDQTPATNGEEQLEKNVVDESAENLKLRNPNYNYE